MHKEKTNTLIIETPEGISFSLLLASPVTRFFAWVIDLACISIAASVLSYVIVSIFSLFGSGFAMAMATIAYFIISIGYPIVLEWYWRGQTLGKRLLKLRVMDEQGLRLQFSQIVIRNLLRFVDALPLFYLVGGVVCAVSKRAQRLGDYAANTIVIRTRPTIEYDLKSVSSDKFNSFREYPHLEARLRQNVSQQEASLALHALQRGGEFDPKARVELFREMADHFRSIVAFPPDASLGLTDEQYVRNIADTLFQPKTSK